MLFSTNLLLFLGALVSTVLCASKNKPHGHNGALDHYNGKPIEFKITEEQSKKLASGEPVRLTNFYDLARLWIMQTAWLRFLFPGPPIKPNHF